MHTESSIFIQAPIDRVFDVTTDLSRWPEILPHYRYVRTIGRDGEGSVVRMACVRSGIPVSWESLHRVDRAAREMHFTHLKAWTKGMVVVWEYRERDGGVGITLRHDLEFRWPLLAPVAVPVIGGFFIGHIANRTLSTFKDYLEAGNV